MHMQVKPGQQQQRGAGGRLWPSTRRLGSLYSNKPGPLPGRKLPGPGAAKRPAHKRSVLLLRCLLFATAASSCLFVGWFADVDMWPIVLPCMQCCLQLPGADQQTAC
jgi:hypothetical protein